MTAETVIAIVIATMAIVILNTLMTIGHMKKVNELLDKFEVVEDE